MHDLSYLLLLRSGHLGGRGGEILRPLRVRERTNRLLLYSGVNVVLQMLKLSLASEDVLGGGTLLPLRFALTRER